MQKPEEVAEILRSSHADWGYKRYDTSAAWTTPTMKYLQLDPLQPRGEVWNARVAYAIASGFLFVRHHTSALPARTS